MGAMSEMEQRRRVRASDAERDYVLYLLQQAHAAGRIDVEELGDRQDKALATRYSDEFIPLLEDLPEGQEVVEILRPRPETPPAPRGAARFIPTFRGDRESLAILSGKKILPIRGTTSYHEMAFMGGDDFDLTDVMGPGVVFVLDAQCVLGGSTIHVPAGVHVVDEMTSVLGGNTIRKKAMGDGSNGTLVLRGTHILSGHTVKLR